MIRQSFRLHLAVLLMLFVSVAAIAQQKAKYVFYFITDGTGVNTVLGAEMYRAELKGEIGRVPFLFSEFPVVGVASTYSAKHGVTDSAASGTALATSKKTYNGAIGVDVDTTAVNSIAVWAKNSGARVGIATSVTANHATPAAFYGHEKHRSYTYDISKDLLVMDVDFLGGSEIDKAIDEKYHKGQPSIYDLYEKNGFTIARGYADYEKKARKAKRMCLLQNQFNPASGKASIPYAIDAEEGDMTIEQIFQAELDFLSKDLKKGFFLMNEIGGKVDWACHANDAAAAFAELEAVDRCVKIAYDFYLKHPDETLIVLTADHETGGFVIAGDHGHNLNLKVLANQKVSQDKFTAILHDLRKATNNNVTWEQAKEVLKENFGFWGAVEMTPEDEQMLQEVFVKSFKGHMDNVETLYAQSEPLADAAKRLLNAKAKVIWASSDHSAGLVPVYAIGVGADLFKSHNDNTLIPLKIAQAAGYTVK